MVTTKCLDFQDKQFNKSLLFPTKHLVDSCWTNQNKDGKIHINSLVT